ncbi:MAG: 4-(cytidine 5'-diphospho)-2-C-methyl-D-erythritol kinase [Candidatus Omnitrophota bacterium]|nr:MAG: 4-(cytidine 5'-diphospho)-2-C-methyl-D-erythritol kinase [Candidatus Omnitrophota bacterium]
MVFPLAASLKKRKNLYGSTVKVLSPAKINLYLNILGKYSNGFHCIESIVERVSLFDEITIRTTKTNTVTISSNVKSLTTDTNLCVRAAKVLVRKQKLPFGFDIFLKKRIPLGAGLGGGSSNAASTLMGINKLLNLKLSESTLYQLGAQLGSDVNFFISQSPFAFISGRGEKVVPFKGKSLRHLIFWPGTTLPTKRVYAVQRAKLTKVFSNVKILTHAIKKGDTALIKNNIFNALEEPALRICKELREVKEYLAQKGIEAKVTGSGSALYTVLDGTTPHKIEGKLANKRWLVFAVCTV